VTLLQIIILGSICLSPIRTNESSESWNNHDKKIVKRASYLCMTRYKLCLKYFIKKAPREYWAICGEHYED